MARAESPSRLLSALITQAGAHTLREVRVQGIGKGGSAVTPCSGKA
jgi:hypothetical protein